MSLLSLEQLTQMVYAKEEVATERVRQRCPSTKSRTLHLHCTFPYGLDMNGANNSTFIEHLVHKGTLINPVTSRNYYFPHLHLGKWVQRALVSCPMSPSEGSHDSYPSNLVLQSVHLIFISTPLNVN